MFPEIGFHTVKLVAGIELLKNTQQTLSVRNTLTSNTNIIRISVYYTFT